MPESSDVAGGEPARLDAPAPAPHRDPNPAPTSVIDAAPLAYPSGFVLAAPPAPAPRRGAALAALILGIAAFVTGWVPILGLLVGVAALVLGIVALVRRQTKGFAITGIALGVVGTFASLVMTVVALAIVTNYDAFAEGFAEGMAEEAIVLESEDPAAEPETEVEGPAEGAGDGAAAAAPDVTAFTPLDDATFAAIVADPNAAVGATHVVYGEIQQFDENTGPCSAIIIVDDAQQATWEGYAVGSWIFAESGETVCPEFDGLSLYSHVKAWVTVLGVTTTEYEDGTTEDLIAFGVRQVEVLPALP